MKIVLLEGCDKCGKTTIGLALASMENTHYFKSVKQGGSDIDLEISIKYDWRFMIDFLVGINPTSSDVFVFDRSFISQWVYSYVFRMDNVNRHYPDVTQYVDMFKSYASKLSTLPHVVFHCYREKFTNFEDSYIKLDNTDIIQRNFKDCFSLLPTLNVVQCRFEDGIETNISKAKSVIENLK